MALFVKVIDGVVNQVWDTPPPTGEAGWRDAVEVKPAIQPGGRQHYSAHRFDLTTNPVQIIYDVVNVLLADRKSSLIAGVNAQLARETRQSARQLAPVDPATTAAAQAAATAKIAAINAATTHDELDALAS